MSSWLIQTHRTVIYQGAADVVRPVVAVTPPPPFGGESPARERKHFEPQIINAPFQAPSRVTPHGWQPVSYEPFIRSYRAALQQVTAAPVYPYIQIAPPPKPIIRQPKLSAEGPLRQLEGVTKPLDLAATSLGPPDLAAQVRDGASMATSS